MLFQNQICRFIVRQDSVAQVVFVKDAAVVFIFLLEGPGITSANLCGIYLFFSSSLFRVKLARSASVPISKRVRRFPPTAPERSVGNSELPVGVNV